MANVIRAKSRTPSSLNYNSLQTLALGSTTLAANQTSAVIQQRCPLAFNCKIVAVSVVPSGAVAGTVAFNIAQGATAYTAGSVPVTDQSIVGQIPSPTALPGQALFAADQAVVMTAEQVQTFYPTLFDAIWPAGSQLTLRLVTNGTAAGNLTVRLTIVPIDNNPTQPQSSNTFFVPGPNTL